MLIALVTRPVSVVMSAPTPDLQRQLAALTAATPERLATLQRDFTALVTGLEASPGFESRLKAWNRAWKVQRRTTESVGPAEIRSYTLTLRDPKLDAWPEIETTLQSLCSIPGVTLERVVIAVATDGEKFDRAEIDFTARLSL
ncbi:MAG: hypothetical protein Q8N18_20490 [Opitutaceae bacterium]|nr:hypothetical protein [Opitutaceae bacterium]